MKRSDLLDIVQQIAHLTSANCWATGGAVRDYILKNQIRDDLELCCDLSPLEIESKLKSEDISISYKGAGEYIVFIDRYKLRLTSLRKEIYQVGSHHPEVVFTTELKDDCLRRGFTIDALYLDATGDVHDYVGGLVDLEEKVIRLISDQKTAINNPIHILQAFKLMSEDSYRFNDVLEQEVRKKTATLIQLEPGNFGNELYSILAGARCSIALEKMKDTGILNLLFPELSSSYSIDFGDGVVPSYTWWQTVLRHIEGEPVKQRVALLFSGLGLNYHFSSSVLDREQIQQYYLKNIDRRLHLDLDSVLQYLKNIYNIGYFNQRALVTVQRPLLIMIGGGEIYSSRNEFIEDFKTKSLFHKVKVGNWRRWLSQQLSPAVEVVEIPMPNKQNAHYNEWKIQFEKCDLVKDREIHLIGHSLGGIFLVKYLVEQGLEGLFKSIHLVSAPYDYHKNAGGFELPADISNLNQASTYLYHAKNDEIVDFKEFGKYQKAIPKAVPIAVLDGGLKGHLIQSTFPEIYTNLLKELT